jgi:hypothetical protein
MKTVKISEISYLEAVIPEIPEFIALSNGSQYLIKDLEKQLAECLRDGEEQARLLGMSGSREAKLLAQIDEFRRERDSLLELKPNADMRELRAACQMALDALIDFHKYGVSSYYAQEAIPKLHEVLK